MTHFPSMMPPRSPYNQGSGSMPGYQAQSHYSSGPLPGFSDPGQGDYSWQTQMQQQMQRGPSYSTGGYPGGSHAQGVFDWMGRTFKNIRGAFNFGNPNSPPSFGPRPYPGPMPGPYPGPIPIDNGPYPGPITGPGGRPPIALSGDFDYMQLSAQDRAQRSEWTDDEISAVHLGGRLVMNLLKDPGGMMTANGNNDIYATILGEDGTGANWRAKPDRSDGSADRAALEVEYIKRLKNAEIAQDGFVSGKLLMKDALTIWSKQTGVDLLSRYNVDQIMHRPAGGPMKIENSISAIESKTQLNPMEQAVMRAFGHARITAGAGNEGLYIPYALVSQDSIDSADRAKDFFDPNAKVTVYDEFKVLLEADMGDDGVANSSATNAAYVGVLDKVFLGAPSVTEAVVKTNAENQAKRKGVTIEEFRKRITSGAEDALSYATQMIKDHPTATGLGTAGMMAGMAICPFLAGLGASGMAQAMNPAEQENKPNNNPNAGWG